MWFAAAAAPPFDFDFPGRVGLAAALAAAGLASGITAFLQFRAAKTTVNPMKPEESATLVTNGMFRLTRNPMYLGMLLILAAWALVVANVAAALLLPLFVVYLNRFQIRPEESALRAHFGSEFERYCAAVRRWL